MLPPHIYRINSTSLVCMCAYFHSFLFSFHSLATDLPSPKFKLGRRGSTFSSMRVSQKASSSHQVRRNTTRVRTRSYKENKVLEFITAGGEHFEIMLNWSKFFIFQTFSANLPNINSNSNNNRNNNNNITSITLSTNVNVENNNEIL
jgi:hypothetical protein